MRMHSLGFTLIELLVVVAIISLLASLVLFSVTNAKNKAIYAKAALDKTTLETALELYYEDNRDWPPVGQPILAYSTPSGGWDTINELLKPYLSDTAFPSYPTIVNGGNIIQAFVYAKGTDTSAISLTAYNSLNGQQTGCITIYSGYYIDFILPQQSNLTLGDGGIDPDGIEYMQGNYIITPPPC